jgi:hypothetical protein
VVRRAARGVEVGQRVGVGRTMSRVNEAIERLEAGKARYRIVLDADF